MKYKVKRIRADMYRLYPSKIAYLYDVKGEFYPVRFYHVKAIGTTIPRQCAGLIDSIKTMHVLLDLKHEVLPGAFMNQTRRNHPDRIYIKGLKRFRIKEFAVMKVDAIIPNWRIYDLTDHKVIAYLYTQQEALQFLHEYYERG